MYPQATHLDPRLTARPFIANAWRYFVGEHATGQALQFDRGARADGNLRALMRTVPAASSAGQSGIRKEFTQALETGRAVGGDQAAPVDARRVLASI